jgi:hypothetical protein
VLVVLVASKDGEEEAEAAVRRKRQGQRRRRTTKETRRVVVARVLFRETGKAAVVARERGMIVAGLARSWLGGGGRV